jgi:hypothetical protein
MKPDIYLWQKIENVLHTKKIVIAKGKSEMKNLFNPFFIDTEFLIKLLNFYNFLSPKKGLFFGVFVKNLNLIEDTTSLFDAKSKWKEKIQSLKVYSIMNEKILLGDTEREKN